MELEVFEHVKPTMNLWGLSGRRTRMRLTFATLTQTTCVRKIVFEKFEVEVTFLQFMYFLQMVKR